MGIPGRSHHELKRLKRRLKNMAKLTAWLVTAIGVIMLLPLLGMTFIVEAGLQDWLIVLGVLAIGISKLISNYSKKRK